MTETMTHPQIVSRSEWLAARKALLVEEKALRKAQDALAARRRRLPMVKIDKPYVFDSESGKKSLLDVFDGRRQLIVYHFMFDPNDPPPGKTHPFSEGCPGCSYAIDNLPHLAHLQARDTTFATISRAMMSKILPFKRRMGWTHPWYSSFGSDFNYDFHVTTDERVAPVEYNYNDKATLQKKGHTYHLQGEQPGLSCFLRLGEDVFHTYSCFARGLEPLLTTYALLDLTALGRQEWWEDSPAGWPQTSRENDWVRHHDRYDLAQAKPGCCSGEH